MKKQTASERNKLKEKMNIVLGEKIKMFSKDLQNIMVDDMVTAFENRLKIFCNLNNEGEGTIA